jgi:formylmethanofuran dehydrogenase subunit C
MDMLKTFDGYLNAPFADSLEKDFEAARASLAGADLSGVTLQGALDSMAGRKDVATFPRKAGLFLSALFQALRRDDSLDLAALGDVLVDGLGAFGKGFDLSVKGSVGAYAGAYLTAGVFTVDGDAGDYCGMGMAGGKIAVKGLCENHAGHSMVGGEILISKNAHDFLGNSMSGGKITVRANAGYSVGYRMVGGVIEIQDLTWDWAGEEMVGGRIQMGGRIGREMGLSMAGGEIGLLEAHKETPRIKPTGGKVVVFAKGKR